MGSTLRASSETRNMSFGSCSTISRKLQYYDLECISIHVLKTYSNIILIYFTHKFQQVYRGVLKENEECPRPSLLTQWPIPSFSRLFNPRLTAHTRVAPKQITAPYVPPPPPRNAVNRWVFWHMLAMTVSPEARATVISRSWSVPSPNWWPNAPWPAPWRYPPMTPPLWKRSTS